MDEARRPRARRDGIEQVAVVDPREGLRHLAAGGVSGAEKQDLLLRVGHASQVVRGDSVMSLAECGKCARLLALSPFPSDNERRLSEAPFWKSRLASEAIGILLLLCRRPAVLALFSYDPHDPNIFSWTAGGEAASPDQLDRRLRRVAGGGPLRPARAWRPGASPACSVVLGWRRFWARPLPNPAIQGRRPRRCSSFPSRCSSRSRSAGAGSTARTWRPGASSGRALADAFRARIGTTGAVLLAITLVLLAIPLATQVSLGDVFLKLRVRFAGLLGRLTVGWARHRDRRTKERLRRTVVAKHLEKARKEDISLDDIPFAPEDAPPIVREVPGPGKFSITKTRPRLRRPKAAAAIARAEEETGHAAEPAPDGRRLHLSRRSRCSRSGSRSGAIDRKVLAETGRPDRRQVRRVRRRGRGRRVPPRARRHDVRVPPGRRHQGQPGHEPLGGPRAGALGRVDPRRAAARPRERRHRGPQPRRRRDHRHPRRDRVRAVHAARPRS